MPYRIRKHSTPKRASKPVYSKELYRCIAADPPWNETGGGRIKRGADRHYSLIKKWPDILRVMLQSPVWRPNPDGCHLWLWVTKNHIKEGFKLMEALGFRHVNDFCWTKAKQDPKTGLWKLSRMGIGQYTRGQHETALFGVMGRLPSKKPRNVRDACLAETGEHSEKPQAAYDHFERVSLGPRLEMFARIQRPGWDAHGNEVQNGKVP